MQRFFLMVDKLAENRTIQGIFETMWQFPDNFISEFIDIKNRIHKITYKTYREQIYSAAASLSSVLPKEKRGYFVGIQLKNCHEWGVIFWAVLMAGFKPVLIDCKASGERTEYLLGQAGAAAVISDNAVPGSFPVIASNQIVMDSKPVSFQPVWENQIAFCTSGTTDTPQL
ncbi:MAG: AMP-binding protein, partial [Eubacteriales bacterium]